MKKLNSAIYQAGEFMWGVIYFTAGVAVLTTAVVFLSRHVTCINLFDKVCFVW